MAIFVLGRWFFGSLVFALFDLSACLSCLVAKTQRQLEEAKMQASDWEKIARTQRAQISTLEKVLFSRAFLSCLLLHVLSYLVL